MAESLGATRPYPYPHSPASFASVPKEEYIGEPCPCDLPPPSLASPQRAGIFAFRLSLTPYQASAPRVVCGIQSPGVF